MKETSEQRKQRLNKQLQHTTSLPGVYKMLGIQGDLLYVGKAKNLKNRLSSYFAKTIEHPKTQALVSRINQIEVLVTRNETEALLLEQNLIKKNHPPYNIMLRDDKSYVYIYLSADKNYPRFTIGRGKHNRAFGKFFGPYPSAANARDTVITLQKLFNVRTCDDSTFKNRQRPCLQYQIKRCSAPCVQSISVEDYQLDVKRALQYLRGETRELDQQLIDQMQQASNDLAFEKAAMYRDRLSLLRQMQAKQAVYMFKGEADVLAIGQKAGVICVQILYVRHGKMLGGKSYFPNFTLSDSLDHCFADFIANFYFQVADEVPSELIVNMWPYEKEQLQSALSQHFDKKILIKHNVRESRAEWLQLAELNLEQAIKQQLTSQLELHERFYQLKQIVERSIDRIECFDISHTMGEATVASCVVFDHAGARKRDYRQFNIKDIQAGDDYAAMRQALTRRYSKHPLPDLLLIDGGKGQLSSAMQVMKELKLDAFMVGVSKGEGRKAGLETLHFTDGNKVQLTPDNKALHLIQQVRDEAHRFAITHHRAKRDKKRAGSVLEVIPGLGPRRRHDLLNHFGGIQGVLNASIKELCLVPGLGEKTATTIYQVLHEPL